MFSNLRSPKILVIGYVAVMGALFPAPTQAREIYEIDLEPGQQPALHVDLQWGRVEIQPHDDAQRVRIAIRGDLPDEVGSPGVEIAEQNGVVTVRQQAMAQGTFRSANLEVHVPRRCDLQLQIRRGGDIFVRGVEGLTSITNLNGSVQLEAMGGRAEVNASNGSINAEFHSLSPEGDLRFITLNGSIELCLPADLAAEVHFSTRGDPIRSDFDVRTAQTVQSLDAGQRLLRRDNEVRGHIGAAPSDGQGAADQALRLLRAATYNGEIALRRCNG